MTCLLASQLKQACINKQSCPKQVMGRDSSRTGIKGIPTPTVFHRLKYTLQDKHDAQLVKLRCVQTLI